MKWKNSRKWIAGALAGSLLTTAAWLSAQPNVGDQTQWVLSYVDFFKSVAGQRVEHKHATIDSLTAEEIFKLPVHSTPPACNVDAKGAIYQDSDDDLIYRCDGSDWGVTGKIIDGDFVAGNIKAGVVITNGDEDVTGTLRYEATTTYSGTDAYITRSGDTGPVAGGSGDGDQCAALVLCREKGDLSVSSYTATTFNGFAHRLNSTGTCGDYGRIMGYLVDGDALIANYQTHSAFPGTITGATCIGTRGS